jgi:hypothetical protein
VREEKNISVLYLEVSSVLELETKREISEAGTLILTDIDSRES